MKQVLLLRHALSSWDDPALDDHDRPLSKRGVRDARNLARALDGLKEVRPDLVLCSSARRTLATWEIVSAGLPVAPVMHVSRDLYLPSLATLTAALSQLPDRVSSVLIAGHSPSLDAFILTRTQKMPRAVRGQLCAKVPTCSLTLLAFPTEHFESLGESSAELRLFVDRRTLKGASPKERMPEKAALDPLPHEARVRDLAMRAVTSAVSQIRHNGAGAQLHPAPELVHQLRVGIRRLRVYLRLFKRQLGEKRARLLVEELRPLFRQLGPLRELQLLLDGPLKAPAGSEPSRASTELVELLETDRKREAERVSRVLSSKRYTALIAKLSELETNLADGKRGKDGRQWLAAKLEGRAARVQRLLPQVSAGELSALHALRKELKKLRYVAELGQQLFPEKRLDACLKQVRRLSSQLGKLCDAAADQAVLQGALSRLPKRTAAALERELAPLLSPQAPDISQLTRQCRKLLRDTRRAADL